MRLNWRIVYYGRLWVNGCIWVINRWVNRWQNDWVVGLRLGLVATIGD
jgi:hypothetical protein